MPVNGVNTLAAQNNTALGNQYAITESTGGT